MRIPVRLSHFKRRAPEQLPSAVNGYVFEQSGTTAFLDAQLAKHRYMLGDAYTIVDMDVWGWARMVPFVLGDDALTKVPNVKRLVDEINAPAAARALALKDRHAFKTEMDDDARRHLFPQNVQPAT